MKSFYRVLWGDLPPIRPHNPMYGAPMAHLAITECHTLGFSGMEQMAQCCRPMEENSESWFSEMLMSICLQNIQMSLKPLKTTLCR